MIFRATFSGGRGSWRTPPTSSLLGHFALTSPQFVVLYTVWVEPGMEQQELAAVVHMDPNTTGGVLQRLESRGWIKRTPSGRSRRGLAIFTTLEGAAVIEQASLITPQYQQALLWRLAPAEQHELLRLLSKAAGIDNSYNDPAAQTLTAPPPARSIVRLTAGAAEAAKQDD